MKFNGLFGIFKVQKPMRYIFKAGTKLLILLLIFNLIQKFKQILSKHKLLKDAWYKIDRYNDHTNKY